MKWSVSFARKAVPAVFCAVWLLVLLAIGGSFALNRRTESTYSEQENRMLQGLPELKMESMLNGSFSGQFENYLLDNFFFRNEFTGISNQIHTLFSVTTMEDTVMAIADQTDELTQAITTLPPLPDELLEAEKIVDVSTASPVLEAPTASPGAAETPELSGEHPAESGGKPAQTTLPAAAAKSQYPATVGIYYTLNGKKTTMRAYRAANVERAAKVLNAYAAGLEEDGRLHFIMVPSSSRANRFILNKSATGFVSNIEDCLRANVADNVSVYSVPEVLGQPIERGEYVYFRTDMHWTPLGAHYAYQAMMESMGVKPVPYNNYTIKQEHPFLGTLYRDNPTAAMKRNPDTLDICMPYGEAVYHEVLGPEKYREIPLIDMNARSSDRFTVYLGNSHSAWSVIDTKAGTGKTALVVRDSFGLCFVSFLIPHYDRIHVVDPRYFKKSVAGGAVRDLMKEYAVDDCYVIVGDLHSFDNDFLMSTMSRILVK